MSQDRAFDPSELEMHSFYQTCIPDIPGSPKLNSPITAGENLMLMMNGEKPLWYPSVGMIGGDYKPFRPGKYFPDMWVAHDCMCGGEPVDWNQVPDVQTGWFGVQQKFVESAGGCMPVPGSQLIDNMNDWEKLPWPDLDAIDWKGCAEENRTYLDSDLPIEFCLPTTFWERLMSILEVTKACLALIDEDQKDAIKAFFDKLTGTYIDLVHRVKEYYSPDIILFHDDWGHQNGPFFSYATHEEMIFPYFKRVVDEIHSLGMRFELHCCGKAETFAPLMVKAGVDLWIPQEMNDTLALARTFKGQGITFGVYLPPAPPEMSDKELRHIAEGFAETYRDLPVAFVDYTRNPQLYRYLYELGRNELR